MPLKEGYLIIAACTTAFQGRISRSSPTCIRNVHGRHGRRHSWHSALEMATSRQITGCLNKHWNPSREGLNGKHIRTKRPLKSLIYDLCIRPWPHSTKCMRRGARESTWYTWVTQHICELMNSAMKIAIRKIIIFLFFSVTSISNLEKRNA